MDEYLPVLAMFGLGVGFAIASFLASGFLATKKPNRAKAAPYESGIVPQTQRSERFPVRFYLVAMIFIIFDIEIIFLYPWAVIFRELAVFGLIEMIVFAVAVFVSFVYLLANGALDWGPRSNLRRFDDVPREAARTGEHTVRVGRPAA